jgi:glycosyltransferase involved in cell wall biosynthesis
MELLHKIFKVLNMALAAIGLRLIRQRNLERLQAQLADAEQKRQRFACSVKAAPFDNRDILVDEISRLPKALDNAVGGGTVNEVINKELLHRYLWILTHKQFSLLPFHTQQAAIQTIFEQLTSSGNANSLMVGQAASRIFRKNLQDPAVTVFDHMAVYDNLYGLYWVGASDLAGMSQFDGDVVKPFSRFLGRHFEQATLRVKSLPATCRLRVCYMVHYAHFLRGNAVGPIVMSLALAQAKLTDPEYDVYLYCVQWFDDAFLRVFEGSSVTVRTFGTAHDLAEVERIRDAFAEDAIDVAITDISSSIATYLFTARVAPLQMWLELGFPYWSIDALDWTFLSHKDYRGDFGVNPKRCSPLRIRQEGDTIVKPFDQDKVADIRAQYPEESVVLGTFVRFSKITGDFLSVVERVMIEDERIYLIIAGGGDPTLILDFLRRSPVALRVTFHQANVDVNIYGRVIDIFVDTFPFCGAMSCREAMMFGKPVVSMHSPDWTRLVTASRDPELVADSLDAYTKKVLRLAQDQAYYADKSAIAQELVRDETDVAKTVEEISGRIQRLRASRTVEQSIPPSSTT